MGGHRSGFVAVIGRPNVGKSTLINRLVGAKISITSRKPQTTRHRILGILSEPACQVVFVDTPGIHGQHRRAMNRIINRTAKSALQGVDAVLLVITGRGWLEDDELALRWLKDLARPVILVINKLDRIRPRDKVLPLIESSTPRYPFAGIVPVSATRNDNIDTLRELLVEQLPVAPAMFPQDQITDRSERFMVGELVREQLFRSLGQELPYATAVRIEDYRDTGALIEITADIWVDREGQKAIVIGKAGEQLKAIGSRARCEIEKLLGRQVHLKLWVKVRSGWADNQAALNSLGYIEE